MIVVAVTGGAVGVIVNVFTWPVTVMTDVKGVADQELVDEVVLESEEVV